MKTILNVISIIGSFTVVFATIFLILEVTIGQINWLKSEVILNTFYLKDLAFTAIALFIILKFVNFYVPNRT